MELQQLHSVFLFWLKWKVLPLNSNLKTLQTHTHTQNHSPWVHKIQECNSHWCRHHLTPSLGSQLMKKRQKERNDGVPCVLWICILVVGKLIIVWAQLCLTTSDWWCRHSSICFVISPSLSLLPLFIVTILAKPVWLNHQSLLLFTSLPFCPSCLPLHSPLPFSKLQPIFIPHEST